MLLNVNVWDLIPFIFWRCYYLSVELQKYFPWKISFIVLLDYANLFYMSSKVPFYIILSVEWSLRENVKDKIQFTILKWCKTAIIEMQIRIFCCCSVLIFRYIFVVAFPHLMRLSLYVNVLLILKYLGIFLKLSLYQP